MIIQCVNCNKKFEVNSSLIPELGRNIQCGSCNHTWFYKPVTETFLKETHEINKKEDLRVLDSEKKKKTTKDKQNDDQFLTEKIVKTELTKTNEGSKFSLGRLLSYILVGMISFIALIILLDTFKSPLNNIFPELELLLYNLFETIKDMFLFFKNLIA